MLERLTMLGTTYDVRRVRSQRHRSGERSGSGRPLVITTIAGQGM